MAMVEITIEYTATEEHSYTVEVDVPQTVLDSGTLQEWLDKGEQRQLWEGEGDVEYSEYELNDCYVESESDE